MVYPCRLNGPFPGAKGTSLFILKPVLQADLYPVLRLYMVRLRSIGGPVIEHIIGKGRGKELGGPDFASIVPSYGRGGFYIGE